VAALLLSACQKEVNHGGKTALMEVDGEFLYKEDVLRIIPYGLASDDSAAFVQDYMRKWAEDMIFFKKAERNVSDKGRIARMVEEYRRALVLNDYEQRLLQEQVSGELEEMELQMYYDENKEFFILEEPIIKGVFLKVPLTAPDLKEMKTHYKDNSEQAREQLEKCAFRNAVIYEYFYDQWMPVSELEGKTIVNLAELSKEFATNRDIEASDEEYCYLLHVDEYMLKGEVKPYDLARYEIIDLLSNTRKVDFMRKVKVDLYNQYLETGRIKTL
jgi:hypothetical protein